MNTKPHAVQPASSRYARNTSQTSSILTRAVAEALEPRRLLATFVVNTTADTVDADPTVTSLREAITDANNLTGVDRIEFNIGGGGPQTIRPNGSMLPPILSGVVIDARTQPGYAGKPLIQISGELAGANADGLRVGSRGSTIRGLVISNFSANGMQITALANGNVITGNYIGTDLSGNAPAPNTLGLLLRGFNNTIGGVTPEDRNVISGNFFPNPSSGRGIDINGPSATANVVLGNYIGVNAAGTAALTNSGDGISVTAGARNNTIGGATPAARNVISGNSRVGIWVNGSNTFGNAIRGNFIGTNPAGTAAVANGFTSGGLAGVMLDNAPGNTVAGNVISGNSGTGVRLTGFDAHDNTVSGNRIGTNAAGAAAVPNTGDGISVHNGAAFNLIGGATPADANLISGNARVGIWVNGSSTVANRILGNRIGTDAAGAFAIGNGFGGDALPGVMIDNANSNLVGDPTPGAGNLISGNNQAGVRITGSSFGNRVLGNRIGTDAAGAAPIPNVGPGVLLQNGASFNRVGTAFDGSQDPAEGNLIAFNAGPGVAVVDGFSVGNAVRFNNIHDNAGLAIDLGNDGVTPNDARDADSGPNNLQNAPIIDAVRDLGAGQAEVTGALFSAPYVFYTIDLYASPAGAPADVIRSARYLGSTFAITDENGYATFAPVTVQLASGEIVTATASASGSNDTSELSGRVSANPGQPRVLVEGAGANGQLTLTLAGAGVDLGGAPVTYAWDLDNDGQFDDSTAANPTLTLPDDGPADRTISLRVTNSAGQSSVNSTFVRVFNADPAITDLTINSSENAPAAPGAPTIVSGHFTDPGLLDTHTATIDWGDGTIQTVALTRPAASADGAFAFTHTFATGGVHGVSVTITDDDGGQFSDSRLAFITGVGVQFNALTVVGTDKNDVFTLSANPDGSVNVAASFLPAPVTLTPTDFFMVNVYLGPKNDRATVNGYVPLDVVINGGDGNDALTLGPSGGALSGGAGNDVLTGAGAYSYLDGGDGNDTLNAGPGYTSAYGGPGNDVINGTHAPDSQGGYYVGGDGNDVITGSAASYEYIYGGNGNDVLSGGGGDDLLFGEAGNDVLHGDAGNDQLYGGDGNDNLFGDAGDDYLLGESGHDVLNGGTGLDTWLNPFDTEDTRISLELF